MSNCAIVSWCVWADGTSRGFDGDGGSAAATCARVRFTNPSAFSKRLRSKWFSSVKFSTARRNSSISRRCSPWCCSCLRCMISTRCVNFRSASATSSGGVSILVLVVSQGAASTAFWAVAAGGGQPVGRCLVGVRTRQLGQRAQAPCGVGGVRSATSSPLGRRRLRRRPGIHREASYDSVIVKEGCKKASGVS